MGENEKGTIAEANMGLFSVEKLLIELILLVIFVELIILSDLK